MNKTLSCPTPAVIIDLDRVAANIAKAQAHADAHGVRLRPHIKTHKLPRFAQAQVEAGAVGITCQKLGEAEVMADAGLTDIFLPYNILGAEKLARLKALNERVRLSVTADNAPTVDGYAATFSSAVPLTVQVECDTGMGRCGVQTPAAALELAERIAAAPGLTFGGLMTYPDTNRHAVAETWLQDAAERLRDAGLPAETVSSGGTPGMWHAPSSVVTEYRPGTYIYFDRSQVAAGVATYADCALVVRTTVISRPTPDRAIIDTGSKALTSDLLGLDGYGYVVDYPAAAITALSEEHGIVDLGRCDARPEIGEVIEIIPNHACPVSNLYDFVYLSKDGDIIETVPVEARGKLT